MKRFEINIAGNFFRSKTAKKRPGKKRGSLHSGKVAQVDKPWTSDSKVPSSKPSRSTIIFSSSSFLLINQLAGWHWILVKISL